MASDPSPDWISSVTRPFNDNLELQLAAQQELVERAADTDPDQLATLTSRFDAIDQTTSPRKRALFHWLPIALAFLVALGIAIPTVLQYLSIRDNLSSMGMMRGTPKTQSDIFRSQLSPADHFALFGDTGQATEELAVKALWQSDPDNPVLYNYYLNHCETYPDDLLETAEQIDSDNGWFVLIAAGEFAKDVTDSESRPWHGPREDKPVVRDWKITDSDKFQESLALIKHASTKSRLERYDEIHLGQRLTLLPPEHDIASRVIRLIHTAATPTKGAFHVLGCSKVLSAHIWQLGQDKDTEGIRAMIPVVEQLCRNLNEQDGFLVSQLVVQAFCRSTYEHLLEACERNGMTEEADRIRPVVTHLRLARDAQRNQHDDHGDLIQKHAGVLTALSAPAVTQFGGTGPTLGDLAPGRRADYALADRVALFAATASLLIAILAALPLPHLRGKLSARLGARFSELLRPSDWLWILTLGTLLPLLWLLAITRLTPLGCRDWSVVFAGLQPVLTQYSIAIVLIIPSTLCAVRWRLGKNAGSLGFSPRRPRWSLVPALLIAFSIPIAGLIRDANGIWPILVAGIIASLATLWLLILTCRAIFGHQRHAPYRAAVARLLPRAFAHAAILLLALLPLTILAERHWITQDALGRTSPENLGMGRLEAQASRALRATIQSALDAKP